MVHEGDELVHAFAHSFLRPQVVQQLDDLRDEQEGVTVGGGAPLALEGAPDGGENGLGGTGKDQVERGGVGHAGR
jgi:hypothetical protein